MSVSYTKHLYGILKCPSTNALRLMRGPLSQAQFAAHLKVAASTLNTWETGKKKPSMTHLLGMLEHYMGWSNKLGLPGLEILACAATEEPTPKAKTKALLMIEPKQQKNTTPTPEE